MKKSAALFFLSLWLLLAAAACNASQGVIAEAPEKLPLNSCQLSFPGMNNSLKAQCGKLMVYENRSSQAGRQIELNIAVVPAISRNPAPDPLFFLAGGPGEAATQAYLLLSGAFQLINQKHDIVLVDQRGTGSSHPLSCASFSSEQETESLNEQVIRDALDQCLKELDADPTMYTTSIAMDDLDQVRSALGYDQINLYGASYGTRAALVYARQYPAHVRTMILDGIVPLNWILGPSVSEDAQGALDMLFARCDSEPKCKEFFPDLQAEFNDILTQVTAQPIQVSLKHPISGEPTQFTLDRDSFVNLIHATTYSAESSALLPLMIHTAYERDDFSGFAGMALSNYTNLEGSINPGMRFSVLCSEDIPFISEGDTTEGYLGDFFERTFQIICSTWPRGEIPADFRQPVTSSVPTLLLSGEADPVTPPKNAELAAENLTNSLQIVVPDQGHIVIFRGCVPKIANSFIENASTSRLDLTCIQEIAPMPIFLNPNGPPP